ncbi:MAG: CPBP family intramembrane metalloprotease, partial [Anaerolineae bacterium]
MTESTVSKWVNAWSFFAATYAASWLVWLPAILRHSRAPNLALVVLGACMPSLVGILFTHLTEDREGRRDFWRRVVEPRRIGLRWGAVILMIFPLAYGASGLAFELLGGDLLDPTDIWAQLSSPVLLGQLVLANLIISGFSEELGWRGFALDRLQRRWGALTASLALGLGHALWHTPLFLIPGISQGKMGLFSLDHFLFLFMVPMGAVIMTLVYNNTRRSILSAILLHCFQNLCLDLVSGLQGALPTGYCALLAGAIGLLA